MPITTTIIIADDHPLTTKGMERALKNEEIYNVIETVQNGIEAIKAIKMHTPDCALLDLSMPKANGLEVFLEAKKWSPNTKFIIITGISAASLFKQLYDAGIDGLFVKTEAPDEIVQGIEKVLKNERVISPEAQKAIDDIRNNSDLSRREREVLQAIACGQSNKQIAEKLGISPNTINIHRTNLLSKMNVNSTAALLVSAMRSGLLDSSGSS